MSQAQTISLTAPAAPSSVAVMRTVAASVAARLDVPYDTIDDLRIAVAEACNRLLNASRTARELRLDVRLEPAALTASVSIPAPPDGTTPDREGSLEWRIIEGLTDRSEEKVENGRLTIVLQIRLAPAPR